MNGREKLNEGGGGRRTGGAGTAGLEDQIKGGMLMCITQCDHIDARQMVGQKRGSSHSNHRAGAEMYREVSEPIYENRCFLFRHTLACIVRLPLQPLRLH